MKSGYLERGFFSAVLPLTCCSSQSSGTASSVLGTNRNPRSGHGVVWDEKGGWFPEPNVTYLNRNHDEQPQSPAQDGVYEITQLVPGNYRLEVEGKGFRSTFRNRSWLTCYTHHRQRLI
jgi:hypothetical protein